MIPFNKVYCAGNEIGLIQEAMDNGQLADEGKFNQLSNDFLLSYFGSNSALLTNSCTSSLEMSAILANIQPGDEVIMPSFTFVSTANAFVLRGASPVFVDIRQDTLNIDENLIEDSITEKTKAIVPVHYGGVSCEMNKIMQLAEKYKLLVIEDAAQAFSSEYDGRRLGSIGDLGCLSFHHTKNIISGEGGALLINNPKFIERAQIIKDKGTNRFQYINGSIDKYSWHDIGSSFGLSEINAAFLFGQLQDLDFINHSRLNAWKMYHKEFADLEKKQVIQRPKIPTNCNHNCHIYYLILRDNKTRDDFISKMKVLGIECSSHYEPLHLSPALGNLNLPKDFKHLKNTVQFARSLVRLPLWVDIESDLPIIISKIKSVLKTYV